MAVKGYWERAVAIPEQGRPPIAYDWYREFLEVLFGVLVAYGEVIVGIACSSAHSPGSPHSSAP